MVADEDGGVYVYSYSGGSNDFIVCQYYDGIGFRYTNGQETIAQGTSLNTDDSFTRLNDIFVVHWLGRGLIVSTMKSSTNFDFSLLFTFLGGYSNLTLPKSDLGDVEADWTRSGYIRNYLPLDVPSDINGLTVTGLGSDSITGGRLNILSLTAPRFYTTMNILHKE